MNKNQQRKVKRRNFLKGILPVAAFSLLPVGLLECFAQIGKRSMEIQIGDKITIGGIDKVYTVTEVISGVTSSEL